MDRITLPPVPIRGRLEEACGLASGAARWAAASGGLSDASVWRLDGGEQSFAVRCWGSAVELERVRQISQTLRTIPCAGVRFLATPIAEPLVDDENAPWEIASWKEGVPVAASLDDVEVAVAGLMQWHAAAADQGSTSFPLLRVQDRVDRLEVIAGRGVSPLEEGVAAEWPELVAILPRLSGAARRAAEAIRAVDWSQTTSQLIHGDARPEHFLIEAGRLNGLIDFGAMRRDTPWADLARLAGELGEDWIEPVAAFYERAGGEPVDRGALAALDQAGAVLSAANWARWLADPGRRWPEPDRVRDRLQSIAARLDRLRA